MNKINKFSNTSIYKGIMHSLIQCWISFHCRRWCSNCRTSTRKAHTLMNLEKKLEARWVWVKEGISCACLLAFLFFSFNLSISPPIYCGVRSSPLYHHAPCNVTPQHPEWLHFGFKQSWRRLKLWLPLQLLLPYLPSTYKSVPFLK